MRVYVGLDNGSTFTERVDLALAEMDRTGAWDRSLIMLVSPTGTGYVNYCAVSAVQYLSRGDAATVTLQYPSASPLSVGKIKDAGNRTDCSGYEFSNECARCHRIVDLESSSSVKAWGRTQAKTRSCIGGRLDRKRSASIRALWIGTPYASRWMQQVTGEDRPDVDPNSSLWSMTLVR